MQLKIQANDGSLHNSIQELKEYMDGKVLDVIGKTVVSEAYNGGFLSQSKHQLALAELIHEHLPAIVEVYLQQQLSPAQKQKLAEQAKELEEDLA